MRQLKQFLALISFAVKRLYTQKWLTLASVMGITIVLTIVVSIPMYSDAINYRIMSSELTDGETQSDFPAFSFLFRYPFTHRETVDWEEIEPITRYFESGAIHRLGLPVLEQVRFFRTDYFKTYPAVNPGTLDLSDPFLRTGFGFMSDLESQMEVLEGSYPDPSQFNDEIVMVMISESLALEYGFRVGDRFLSYIEQEINGSEIDVQIEAEVSGIWKPIDKEDDYWHFEAGVLDSMLTVPQEVFVNRISPLLNNEIYVNGWYFLLDSESFHADEVDKLLLDLGRIQNELDEIFPDTSLSQSPKNALNRYKTNVNELTFYLFVASVPIVGLLLVFINLVVDLTAQNRQNQMAVLRSRGASVSQLLVVVIIETLILSLISLGIALPLGMMIARVMGNVQSFLNFASQDTLRIAFSGRTIWIGVITMVLMLIVQIIPALSAAKITIVSYKQEQARALKPPFWQRAWLDVLLMLPTGYGAYLLNQQGAIGIGEGAEVFDPFQNPLLLLVPALGILSASLLVLRVLPWILSLVSWVLSKTKAVGAYFAIRQLSRTPKFYSAPLILLILTLSLSMFTATMAQTLDQALVDSEYYRVGSDLFMQEVGLNFEGNLPGGLGAMMDASEEDDEAGTAFFYLPYRENLKIPGVEAVSRVGQYSVSLDLSGGFFFGTFLGVDRIEFPDVAFWREDFADEELVDLMNRLAVTPNGVLVNRSLLEKNQLSVGDTINIRVSNDDQNVDYPVIIVAAVDYFPTWYPETYRDMERSLVVGNLDYYFEQISMVFEYDLWLETSRDADPAAIASQANQMDLGVVGWNTPRPAIEEEQRSPNRQGLFGILSIGFLSAAFLTVLGFLIYWIFSFRRRFVELGVLQAIGLSPNQMMSFLGWELIIITFVGGLFGTLLGIGVSNFFIPFLQLGQGAEAYPPFLIEISWSPVFRIYVLFGLLFVIAFSILVVFLRRMKIFQALKLGETL